MAQLVIAFLVSVAANVVSTYIICGKDCPLAGGFLTAWQMAGQKQVDGNSLKE